MVAQVEGVPAAFGQTGLPGRHRGFQGRQPQRAQVVFMRPLSSRTCSNWKTMLSSCRAGSVNSTASGIVAPGHLADGEHVRVPAGEDLAVHLGQELVVARAEGEVLVAGAVPGPGPRLRVRQRRVLADHVDDVHPEPVHAAGQPPPHHGVDGLADLGVLPVQVGLLGGEDVQVVLAGGLIPGPGGAGEVGLPVGGFGARRARRVAGARVAPPVPVPLGVVRGWTSIGQTTGARRRCG